MSCGEASVTHILLTSPRRMGKMQLIRHVFEQPSIKDSFYTFYTDIYPTTSLHELVLFLSKEIYSVLVPNGKTVIDRFLAGPLPRKVKPAAPPLPVS